METKVMARVVDPTTAARFLGESVGTHYSVALRAAKAYSTHLASNRRDLLEPTYDGEGLGAFWRELLRSEQVQIGSTKVLQGLSTEPSHYFHDFLETAETVYRSRYEDSSSNPKKSSGKSEHAQCLRFLRDHNSCGPVDHFTVQNKVATWMQLLRIMGKYVE